MKTFKRDVVEAKHNWIRTLLCLGLVPQLEIIARGIPAHATAEWEKQQIKIDAGPWLLNSTQGGEGVRAARGGHREGYRLRDPRDGNPVCYVGITQNAVARLQEHIAKAQAVAKLQVVEQKLDATMHYYLSLKVFPVLFEKGLLPTWVCKQPDGTLSWNLRSCGLQSRHDGASFGRRIAELRAAVTEGKRKGITECQSWC